jgi:phage terminase large subunit-like protein
MGNYFFALSHFWLPKEGLRDRVRRDRVEWDVWARDGLVTLCDGPEVDYQRVIADIVKLKAKYNIKQLAFDRWGSLGVWQELKREGFDVAAFGQGFGSMSAPTKELLTLIALRRWQHDGNPVLRWMADSVQTTQDAAGNIKFVKPDRNKSSVRIDGMVAAVMALALASAPQAEKPRPSMVLL